jgi:TIR domain
VRAVRDALVAEGFDVFWDQQVPSGKDWNTCIRERLGQSKCVLVFCQSVISRNVRHEAIVADQQGKLTPVLLETITAEQVPIGLYTPSR